MEAWMAMVQNRELIARVHPMAAAKAMMGMVQEKYHAMEHRYPSRAHIVDKFGYDPKQLQHLIRMAWFLEEYVNDWHDYEKILTLDFTENMSYDYRVWLMNVKRGREYNLEEARGMATIYLQKAERALNRAKENWSPEPDDSILCAMDDILGDIVRIAIKYEMAKEAE
jgi:hypothetical protein